AIYRETCQYTIFHGFLKSFLYRWDKFFWHVTTFHFVYEDQAWLFRISRSDGYYDIRKLTTTTRLLLVHFSVIDSTIDGFFVRYLWRTLVNLYLKLTLKTVYNNIQVKLTHPANYGLT